MRFHSESKALQGLARVRNEFAKQIRTRYEHRAQPCASCKTPGACCLDEHFVNVRITRLEATAIKRRLAELPEELQLRVSARTEEAIERYGLDRQDVYGAKTYSCPLFEKGIGCLVHDHAKPLPCIAHACYENKEDLPPDNLLTEREIEVDRLNESVYPKPTAWLPLPVAIKTHKPER